METRLLPRSDWSRLDATDLSVLLPYVAADDTKVIVIEDAGRIVACWAVCTMVHLEGLWIDPAYRGKASVARSLFRRTWEIVRSFGRTFVMTGAQTPDVSELLAHLGAVEIPMRSYLIAVEQGERLCQPSS